MASRRSSQVFSIRRLFIPCLLSVLFIQTTVTAPAPSEKSQDNIDLRLNNPCNYNPHPLRHQRSLKNPDQRNYTHVQAELRKVRKLTTKTLKMFQKMYQNSTTLKWHYQLVPDQMTSKVVGYHGLQIFMKAIYLMSKQSFPSTNKVSAKKRSQKLTELLNKSTVLLCEIYDDIHANNQTTEVLPVAKNRHVEDVDESIPQKIERTALSTQDREVLKKYKKFLRDLWQFYRQEKKKASNKNKPNKNNDSNKKGDNNKSNNKKNSKNNSNNKNRKKQRRATQQKIIKRR